MNMQPRGIRNNNPGNIRRIGNWRAWQGLADAQPDPEFLSFQTPEWGIRAIARTLITYQDKRRARDGSPIDTVREVIERWAPPIENDTGAYVAHVRARLGLGEAEHPGEVDLHRYDDLRTIVEAIIRHENGRQPYTGAQIDKALVLAGVPPPMRSLQASRTVKGAQVAAGGGAIATAAGSIAAIGPAVPVLHEIAEFVRAYPTEMLVLVGLLALAGAGIAAYAKWDERRRGIA